jgi:CubicO group peptidase (beta-lactamase class C family)
MRLSRITAWIRSPAQAKSFVVLRLIPAGTRCTPYHRLSMIPRCKRITGQSWETYTRAHIFIPLGMTTASFGPIGLEQAPDRGQPYRHEAVLGDVPVPWDRLEYSQPLAPAGGIDDRQYSQVISFNTPWTSNSLPAGVGPDNSALFVVTNLDFLVDGDPNKGQDSLVRYGSETSKAAGQAELTRSAATRSSQPLCYVRGLGQRDALQRMAE